MTITRRSRQLGVSNDPTNDYVAEAEAIRLQRIDEADAQAKPEAIDQPWVGYQYDERSKEQPDLFEAEGEVSARPASMTAKSLDIAAGGAKHRIDVQQQKLDAALAFCLLVGAVLRPFTRREPHAKRWYVFRWLVLILGDIAGISGAAILLGEIVSLAIMQATASGMAAVTAGIVGHDIRDMQLQRRRARDATTLTDDQKKFVHLFQVSYDAEKITKAVLWAAATVGFLISAGIFALRSGVEGTSGGVIFSCLAAGLAIASFLNTYIYADEVADLIDTAELDYKRELKRHEKLSNNNLIRRHAEAGEQARSIRAEFAVLGQAAARAFQALKYLIFSNNPGVLGHGPAPQPSTVQDLPLFNHNDLDRRDGKVGS